MEGAKKTYLIVKDLGHMNLQEPRKSSISWRTDISLCSGTAFRTSIRHFYGNPLKLSQVHFAPGIRLTSAFAPANLYTEMRNLLVPHRRGVETSAKIRKL